MYSDKTAIDLTGDFFQPMTQLGLLFIYNHSYSSHRFFILYSRMVYFEYMAIYSDSQYQIKNEPFGSSECEMNL